MNFFPNENTKMMFLEHNWNILELPKAIACTICLTLTPKYSLSVKRLNVANRHIFVRLGSYQTMSNFQTSSSKKCTPCFRMIFLFKGDIFCDHVLGNGTIRAFLQEKYLCVRLKENLLNMTQRQYSSWALFKQDYDTYKKGGWCLTM